MEGAAVAVAATVNMMNRTGWNISLGRIIRRLVLRACACAYYYYYYYYYHHHYHNNNNHYRRHHHYHHPHHQIDFQFTILFRFINLYYGAYITGPVFLCKEYTSRRHRQNFASGVSSMISKMISTIVTGWFAGRARDHNKCYN